MTDPRLLLSHEFPPETRGSLDDLETALRDRLPDAEVVRATDYTDSVAKVADAEIIVEHGLYDDHLDAAESLQWVQSLSSGANRYDRDRLRDMDVLLTTASGVHARPIAEQVLTYLLAFERDLLRGLSQQRDHEWRRFPAGELSDCTLVVVGVGTIGGRIAELASTLGMDMLGVRGHPDRPHAAVDKMVGPDALHSALGRADYAVLACPLTEATRRMVGPAELTSLGNDGVLVNVARGAVVDQDALTEALQTGDLRGAALDVFEKEPLPAESPLWNLSNVVVTPHMAGGTPLFPERCAEIIAENYRHFVAGDYDEMRNRVL
jgi:phosphoglycerate dehydrogenase-like enzyme